MLQAKRIPLSFVNPSFNNRLQWTPAPLLVVKDIFSSNGHHFQDDRQEESCIPCEPIRNFLEIGTSCNHQLMHAEVDVCKGSDICKVDCGDRVSAMATSSCPVKHIQNNCTGQSVEPAGSGFDMSILDNYIVPLSLIERWGSAMGILYTLFIFSVQINNLMANLLIFWGLAVW